MIGIDAITGGTPGLAAARAANLTNVLPSGLPASDFASILTQGLQEMDAKVAHAENLVTRFAVDDSIPVHQVTIALDEARLSVEFAMQVRARLVEGYRELMNMQL